MDKATRVAAAIRSKAARTSGAQVAQRPIIYAKWVSAEVVDANLSQIRVAGAGLGGNEEIIRYVPKLSHVTGLTENATVLCAGNPLCIIGIVVGDITLAT